MILISLGTDSGERISCMPGLCMLEETGRAFFCLAQSDEKGRKGELFPPRNLCPDFLERPRPGATRPRLTRPTAWVPPVAVFRS